MQKYNLFGAIFLQGKGNIEDRVEMLRRIVDLVEACTFADNPQWRSLDRASILYGINLVRIYYNVAPVIAVI